MTLLSLCSKTLHSYLSGPILLKLVRELPRAHHKFLQLLERDLPINYLYCSADEKFHYAEISTGDDPSHSLVTFPSFSERWTCVAKDEKEGISLSLGIGLCFYQARMLLKLFAWKHPLAESYLESFNSCQVTRFKPCAFLRRELKVRSGSGNSPPSLFVTIQHWSLLRHRNFLKNPYPKPRVCDHNPRDLPSRRSETFCLARSPAPQRRIDYCRWCGTEFRDNTVEFTLPLRLHISSRLPFRLSRRYKAARCTTRRMNLHALKKGWPMRGEDLHFFGVQM